MNPALEFVTKITFASNYSTVHYNIRDSTGRSMVLEYGGPNNLQVSLRNSNTSDTVAATKYISPHRADKVALFSLLRALFVSQGCVTFNQIFLRMAW